MLVYWHTYRVEPIHLHVSRAEGATAEKKPDLTLYPRLWPFVERPRGPPPSPGQPGHRDSNSYHWMVTLSASSTPWNENYSPWGWAWSKNQPAPSSASSLLFHPNDHVPPENGIWGAVTEALTSPSPSSTHVEEKAVSLHSTHAFIKLTHEANPSFFTLHLIQVHVFLKSESKPWLPGRRQDASSDALVSATWGPLQRGIWIFRTCSSAVYS